MYAQVIVDIAHENVDRVYSYRIPAGMEIERGMRVKVPFGRQVKEGYVLELADSADYDADKIRDVIAPLEDYSALLPQLIDLAKEIAQQTHCPMAEALRLMLPAEMRGGRIKVNRLDGINVNFNGNYNTLVIHNQDNRGHIADVTSALSIAQVNVASMSLHRNKRGGDALMIIETDQPVPEAVRELLSRLPGILKLTYYDKTREEADECGVKLHAGDFRSDGEIR